MNLAIEPGPITKVVEVPPSKSYANRALILASCLPRPIRIEDLPEASDVTFLVDALTKLGLGIKREATGFVVQNSFPACETTDLRFDIGEGGTTARFLAVLLLKGSRRYELLLGERLRQRPWDEFITLAGKLGAKVSLDGGILSVQGPVSLSGSLSIDCSKTTQFLTGFQLVYSREAEIRPQGMTSSQSYVRMTEKIIDELSPSVSYTVPRDWSSATYAMAFAALHGETFFPRLRRDPFQADAKFFDLLEKFGAIEETEAGIRVSKIHSSSQPVTLDVSDCLDLVPTLTYFLAHIPGTHRLTGISNLVHKESDRLTECLKLLRAFGRPGREEMGSLIIEGTEEKVPYLVSLELPEDHRMVMAGSLFLRHHSGGTVSPSEAVEKSYPNFFELFSGVR